MKSGRTYVESSEPGGPARYGDVTTWLEGEVRRRPQDGLDAAAAHRLGVTLARIHSASQTFVVPAEAELPHYDGASLATEASPHNPGPLGEWFSPEDLEIVREVTRRAHTVFAQARDEAQVGTLHKDFILGNCLWHGSNLRVLEPTAASVLTCTTSRRCSPTSAMSLYSKPFKRLRVATPALLEPQRGLTFTASGAAHERLLMADRQNAAR